MCNMVNSIKVARGQIYKSATRQKNIIIFILLGMYLYELCEQFADFSRAVQVKPTPFAIIYIINDYRCQILIMACVVVLFCDAPFHDESHYFIISRVGIRTWDIGQILYIGTAGIIYVLFLVGISVLPFLFYCDWTNEWGKVWRTMATRDVSEVYHGGIEVSPWILDSYSPIEALIVTMLFEWLCVCFIGLVIYFFNNVTEKSFGNFVAAFIVLLDILASNEFAYYAIKLSPITVAQIDMQCQCKDIGLDITYASVFFGISLVILIFFSAHSGLIKRWIWVKRRRI